MAKNKGILITATIRPNDSLDDLAVSRSSETMGGHHSSETLADRDAIFASRREWGMLCSVWGDADPSANRTYVLKKDHASDQLSDNNNWVAWDTYAETFQEWATSAISELNSAPVASDGDRYLVGNSPTGAFAGKAGQIAMWSDTYTGTGGWLFFSPTASPTGAVTMRIDNEQPSVRYWNGSAWTKQYSDSIVHGTASGSGTAFTATWNYGQYPLSWQTHEFNLSFAATATGTATLYYPNLGTVSLKKAMGTSLLEIVSGDLVPGITYKFTYNRASGCLQTYLPLSSIAAIGAAEDGDYTDGLWTDFTPSTPIGTPIDRMNELLGKMVPPSAPVLSTASVTGNFLSSAILSFDNTDVGYVSATNSVYAPVPKGSSFSASNKVLGVVSGAIQPVTGTQYYGPITGTVNGGVLSDTSVPYPAYASSMFGQATTGTLSLLLNGTTVSNMSLSSFGASNSTMGGTATGIEISAAEWSKFPFGATWSSGPNRTAKFVIAAADPNIARGYNKIEIKHISDTFSRSSGIYEFVADFSTASVTVTNPRIFSTALTGGKYLSGIEYYTTPSVFVYRSTISGHFGDTFPASATAISFNDKSYASYSQTVVKGQYWSGSSFAVPVTTGVSAAPSGALTPASSQNLSMTYSLNTGARRLNDELVFDITVQRSVQGTFSGGTALGTSVPVANWFIDSCPPTSTDTAEHFDDEAYRLPNTTDKYGAYSTTASVLAATWNSSDSLADASGAARNGLQVVGGRLVYPAFDFSAAGATSTNPNFGTALRDYSACGSQLSGFPLNPPADTTATTNRTYTRKFYFGQTENHSDFILSMNWEGCVFVGSTQSLTGTQSVCVEAKLPYGKGTPPGGTVSNGGTTGWLDATKPFKVGEYSDTNGCLDESSSGDWSSIAGSDWAISFGEKGTYWSDGYVLLRITAGKDWQGYINSITIRPK